MTHSTARAPHRSCALSSSYAYGIDGMARVVAIEPESTLKAALHPVRPLPTWTAMQNKQPWSRHRAKRTPAPAPRQMPASP